MQDYSNSLAIELLQSYAKLFIYNSNHLLSLTLWPLGDWKNKTIDLIFTQMFVIAGWCISCEIANVNVTWAYWW